MQSRHRLFIETKYRGKLELPKSLLQKLPSRIVLAMPVQYLGFQTEIKKQLISAGKEVALFKSRDGKFHPTALLYKNKKKVFCYNPFTEKIEVLEEDYLQKQEQKKKGQLSKLLSSKNIGVIISTKPGQNQTKKAEELKEKLEKEGKSVYLFLTDEINVNQLPNFNFIEVWVNTACPRLVEDFNGLNLEDLREICL